MRTVAIRDVVIGENHPVAVQTMYDCPIPPIGEKMDELLRRISTLKSMGCDIIRFSYPDIKDHDNFTYLCAHSVMPVVADIHFDYRCALDAIECGADKIRINPGNIGAKWKTEEVVRSAKEHGCAIRIGLNKGSLPRTGDSDPVKRMVDTSLEYIQWCEALDFHNIVVSLKSSDPEQCDRAARLFAEKSDYPLHLGVTEAGGVISSVTRSTWVLGNLLKDGIGSTMRISITGAIEDEVYAAVELLRTLGLKKSGIRIVSCPRCGRCSFDSQGFLKSVQNDLLQISKPITVAIMGCQVNGPGEAKGAQVAITGLGNAVFLYRDGELARRVDISEAKESFLEAVRNYDA